MTLFDQLQRGLTAEGVEGTLEHVLLTVRLQTKDTAHVAIRRAPSDAEAVEWLETEGRRFIEPYAVARVEGDHRPVHKTPAARHRVVRKGRRDRGGRVAVAGVREQHERGRQVSPGTFRH